MLCRPELSSEQIVTGCSLPCMLGIQTSNLACRHRPAYIYDATVSYPMAARDTVPTWAAYIVPFILLLISVSVSPVKCVADALAVLY